MKRVQDHLIFKISLLSISLFIMMAAQISSVLPMMYHAFPGVHEAGVDMLTTVPSFGILIGLLVNPWTIRRFGSKATVLAGLAIALVAGVIPMFSNNYQLILASRFVLGFGIGLFNSLAVSLIPHFYKSDENTLATMVGLQNVTGGLGAVIASFLVSYLAKLGWHAAFGIYFLIIPSLILFAIFVPLKKGQDEHQGGGKSTKHQRINQQVVLLAVLFFITYLFYMPFSFAMPRQLVEQHMGNSSTAALITAFSMLIAIPFGVCFGFFFKHLHDKLFPLTYFLLVVGFLLMAIATNLPVFIIGTFIVSLGFTVCVSYLYNWLDWAAPEGSINLGTTIVLITTNIGTFISPMVVDSINNLIGNGTARFALAMSSFVFLLLLVYALVHYSHVHLRHRQAGKNATN